MSPPQSPPRYIAEVVGSQEVTLVGHADAAFWAEKLADEGLFPFREAGQAKLTVGAVASRWMGVGFAELMVAVTTASDRSGTSPNGMFLVSAYNTSRFFTFVERYYFKTPYSLGKIDLDCGDRNSFRLVGNNVEFLDIRRESHIPFAVGDEDWEGPLFLPRRLASRRSVGNVYYVRLRGQTETAAFDHAADVVKIAASPADATFAWLIESRFRGVEWHIRRAAHHARSQTFPRVGSA